MLIEVSFLVESHLTVRIVASVWLLLGVDAQVRVELTQAAECLEAEVVLVLEVLVRYVVNDAALDHPLYRVVVAYLDV